jgi:hypothetical protein
MNEKNPAEITELEPAASEEWLTKALAPARARVKDTPSVEAVARVRARVLSETTPAKRRIAA